MNFSINGNRFSAIALLLLMTISWSSIADQLPHCSDASFDSDGDGWGWENQQSCIVVSGESTPLSGNSVSGGGNQINCGSNAVDPDNDGWGWENNQSCRVVSQGAVGEVVQAVAPVVVPVVVPVVAPVVDVVSSLPTDSNSTPDVSQITDLFLITGQSNLRAAETSYDAYLDAIDARVFAFTEFGQWSVADLHQPWDDGWYPGNGSWYDSSRQPYNNLSFHFAKSLVALDPSRVVGFIVASAPGKGIAHWDADDDYWRVLRNKVQVALDAQGYDKKIDAVLWHQGETDWLYNGTADPEVFGSERTEAGYYPRKLDALISAFRAEEYSGKGIFICGETVKAALNPHLMALNDDGDSRTGCVAGSDLALRPDEVGNPDGVHFSAQSLRDIGWRYAQRYLAIDNSLGN